MVRHLVRALSTVVGVGLAPLTVVAQRPVAQDSVRRSQDSTPKRLAPIVITGSRIPVPTSDLTFAVSSLDSVALRREPSPNAGTVLNRLPSISMDEEAGVAGPTSLRLRGGEEAFTQVMFDGVPLNVTGGFMDLQGLTLTNVERVEVARGPQSVIYGSSAMAGAVQFITRSGVVGPPRVTAVGEGGGSSGSGGQGHGELALTGGSGSVRYALGGGGTYFRGIYDLPNDLTTWDGSARVDANAGRAWAVGGTLRYQDISSKLPVRDPGVTRAPLDPNQRDARNRWLGSVQARFTPTDAWEHRVAVAALRDDFSYEDQADGLDPANYPFFVFDFNYAQTSVLWRASGEYTGTWRPLADRTLAVAFGGRYERERQTIDQSGDFGDGTSRYTRGNGAGFAEVQGRVGSRVDVLAGARYHKFEGLAGEFLPRGGATVAVVPGVLNVRASAGKAFKAANLDQQYLENPFTRPNPDLKPETTVGWEAGLVGMASGAGLTVRGTFFHQTYDDLIRLVPVDTTGVAQNQNLGKSRVVGVELELDKWWGDRWHAGATWLNGEVVDNTGLSPDLYPVGSPLLGVPRWTGNAVIDGTLTSVLSASLRGRLVGEQEVFTERFFGERVTIDSYFLLGLTVRARITGWSEAYVRGENLLDTGYLTAYDRPGLPLTVVGGMRVTTP
jgi:vitamin B12 transporter